MTGRLTAEQLNEPLATLERYGLSTRTLSMLEDEFDAIYVRDLWQFDGTDVLERRQFGDRILEELRESLRKFVSKGRTG